MAHGKPGPTPPPKLASLEQVNAVMADLFKDQHSLRRLVLRMGASLIVMAARAEATLEAFHALASQTGVTCVDGVPVDDWFEARWREHAEHHLIAAENLDPALAASWQEAIDRLNE